MILWLQCFVSVIVLTVLKIQPHRVSRSRRAVHLRPLTLVLGKTNRRNGSILKKLLISKQKRHVVFVTKGAIGLLSITMTARSSLVRLSLKMRQLLKNQLTILHIVGWSRSTWSRLLQITISVSSQQILSVSLLMMVLHTVEWVWMSSKFWNLFYFQTGMAYSIHLRRALPTDRSGNIDLAIMLVLHGVLSVQSSFPFSPTKVNLFKPPSCIIWKVAMSHWL